MTKLQKSAKELLDGIAHDHALGASGGWDYIQKVEARFRLKGYTMDRIMLLEDTWKAQQAVRTLARLSLPHEPRETDTMHRHCAMTALNDARRARGPLFVESIMSGQR